MAHIKQNIAKKAIAAEGSGGGSQSPSSSNTSNRVGIAVIEPFVIDTRHTIGTSLFGKKSSQVLFSLVKGPVGLMCLGSVDMLALGSFRGHPFGVFLCHLRSCASLAYFHLALQHRTSGAGE